uniref:Proteophosphoglycan ppg4 n=1 Tax=Moniliophthora roreri TaxID=221103 RepID=A0A0W0FKN0_MONRR
MATVPLLFYSLLGFAAAAPAGLERRETSSNNTQVNSKVWIPIVITILFLFSVATLAWSKKKWRPRLSSIRNAAAAAGAGTSTLAAGSNGTMRELTADQLTGRNDSSTNTLANTNNNADGRTRRTRRPRRTPSQMSTTSLPAYMKEPGEQELVIFRGPADMEDVPIPSVTTVDIPRNGEDGDSEQSHRERYTAMPDSPHDMPLLQNDEPVDPSSRDILPQDQRVISRRSVDTMPGNSDSDGSSLMRIDTTVTLDEQPSDPRGSAPAYFEVVDLSQMPGSTIPIVATSPTNNDTTTNAITTTDTSDNNVQQSGNSNNNTVSNRRSTFRFTSIFGRGGNSRTSTIPAPPGLPVASISEDPSAAAGHNRSDSAGVLSLTSTLSRSISPNDSNYNRSRSRLSTYNHRPSQSSSSLLSLVNPLARKKSSPTMNDLNNLTSPSLISLNSISAPLSHTLVKTEFTYPKSGPTPEQLKLISSRESMMRFGVPYGEEAVRWARSRTELVEDGVPPPEFEDATRSSSSGQATTSANTAAGPNGSGSSSESPSARGSLSAAPPEIRIDPASIPPSPRMSIVVPSSLGGVLDTVGELSSPKADVKSEAEVKVHERHSTQLSEAETATITTPSSPLQPQSTPKTDPAFVPIPDSPPSTSPVLPSASAPVQIKNAPAPLTKGVAPPSSFRAPPISSDDPMTPNTPNYARAESRASSFRSFATARESLNEFGERRPGTGMAGTFGTMRSETPADSLYYSDVDGYATGSDLDSGDETETEVDERRMTLRP